MNILHLNTYTYKHNLSFPHYQIHKALLKEGENTFVLSAKGDLDEREIGLLNRGSMVPYFGISRIIRKVFFEIIKSNDTNFFYPEWNLDFITEKQILNSIPFKPNIIITYWTKFAFNQKLIYKLSKTFNVPILCFMMDMAPMTGGCHYAYDCKNFHEKCGRCPALNSNKKRDLSNINWEFKKKYIEKTNITFIASSTTLVNQAIKSSLLKNKKIERIMLIVNEETFKPENKEKAREKFDIPFHKKVIFFGAASIKEKRKGIVYLIDALKILSEKMEGTSIKDETMLLIAGKNLLNFTIPFEYKHVGYLSTEKELALAYQACDMFICPSIEDSGPLMINQSIMSGRPVVSFDMGVAPDLVHTGKTGYRAKLKDIEDLAAGLESILTLDDKRLLEMSNHCRDLGMELCSFKSQYNKMNGIIKNLTRK